MGWSDWIPAITTTSLLGAVLWLLRSLITARLAKAVEHEFDAKLELIRSELRRNEEQFKEDLRSKQREIEALRSGAMSGLAGRQALLDKRRIEAVDQLWAAVQILSGAKPAAAMISVLNFEKAAQQSFENPRAREVFSIVKVPDLDIKDAQKARPYLSPIVWALFLAYASILAVSTLKLRLFRNSSG